MNSDIVTTERKRQRQNAQSCRAELVGRNHTRGIEEVRKCTRKKKKRGKSRKSLLGDGCVLGEGRFGRRAAHHDLCVVKLCAKVLVWRLEEGKKRSEATYENSAASASRILALGAMACAWSLLAPPHCGHVTKHG